MTNRALITGILGQDGPYLAQLLLSKGYEVHGLARLSSELRTRNLDYLGITREIRLHQGDIADSASIAELVRNIQPTEVYNLAANSSAASSWALANYTAQVNSLGALNLLEAIHNHQPDARYFQAGSSDQFGSEIASPLNEQTPFAPTNPYAVSKLYAHWITKNFREGYKMHASNGILFNHESSLRSENFILSRIVHAAVRIKLQQPAQIQLGGIDVVRDWGASVDFVRAMWMMLQHDKPDDYVVCTGRPASFRDLIQITFDYLNIPNWEKHVKIDTGLKRPTEVVIRYGDPTHIQTQLGWKATITLEQLIAGMVDQTMENIIKKHA
jgi:GDPmannose 4,6-dehydratase